MVAEQLTALLDQNPDPAAEIRLGRYVKADGTLTDAYSAPAGPGRARPLPDRRGRDLARRARARRRSTPTPRQPDSGTIVALGNDRLLRRPAGGRERRLHGLRRRRPAGRPGRHAPAGCSSKARRRQRAEALLRERLPGADGLGIARARRARPATRGRRARRPSASRSRRHTRQCTSPNRPARRRRSRSARATRRSRRRAGSRSARSTRTASGRTRSAPCATTSSPATRHSANEADVRVDGVRHGRAQAGHARRLHRRARASSSSCRSPTAPTGPRRTSRRPSSATPFRFALPCAATSEHHDRRAAAHSRRRSTRSCPARWSRASARSGSWARSTSSTAARTAVHAGRRQHAVRAQGVFVP